MAAAAHEIINQQSASRKAKAILNRLVSTKQLDPESVDAIFAILDPFHDTPIPSPRWPDGQNTRSVARTERIGQSITRGTVPAGNWDCLFLFNPTCRTTNLFIPCTYSVGQIPLAAGARTERLRPGWNVIKAPAGQIDFGSLTLVTENDISPGQTAWPDNRRLVASALEVTNVSAPLEQSGTCIPWRAPAQMEDVQLVTAGGPPVTTGCFKWNSGFPYTLAEATNMQDTETWAAKDGCYIVVVPDGIEQPVQCPDGKPVVFTTNPSYSGGTPVYMATPTTTPAGNFDVRTYKFNACGAYFTGLKDSTTLTAVVKYSWEDFPSPRETQLAQLAQPTPPFDPLAIEILSRAIRKLPVGVPVNENPLGEWFDDVMSAIAAIAPALSAIPVVGAFAPAVGALAAGAAGVNRSLRAAETAKAASQAKLPPPIRNPQKLPAQPKRPPRPARLPPPPKGH